MLALGIAAGIGTEHSVYVKFSCLASFSDRPSRAGKHGTVQCDTEACYNRGHEY